MPQNKLVIRVHGRADSAPHRIAGVPDLEPGFGVLPAETGGVVERALLHAEGGAAFGGTMGSRSAMGSGSVQGMDARSGGSRLWAHEGRRWRRGVGCSWCDGGRWCMVSLMGAAFAGVAWLHLCHDRSIEGGTEDPHGRRGRCRPGWGDGGRLLTPPAAFAGGRSPGPSPYTYGHVEGPISYDLRTYIYGEYPVAAMPEQCHCGSPIASSSTNATSGNYCTFACNVLRAHLCVGSP